MVAKQVFGVVILMALAAGCGGPPADVGGSYSGQASLNFGKTPGESQSTSEFLLVQQNGGEIKFSLSGCSVRAFAASSTTFSVEGFSCSRTTTTKTWTVNITEGTVVANAASLNVQMKGVARSGTLEEPVTMSFNGSKT